MGGHGSGRWKGYQAAICIEDILYFLDIATLSGQLRHGDSTGTLTWMSDDRPVGSVHYALCAQANEFELRLYNLVRAGRRFERAGVIALTATRPPFGGRRWWFKCPDCQRSSRKLFLLPSRIHFRCRRCHGLTYRSCQESHTLSGLATRLRRIGVLPALGAVSI